MLTQPPNSFDHDDNDDSLNMNLSEVFEYEDEDDDEDDDDDDDDEDEDEDARNNFFQTMKQEASIVTQPPNNYINDDDTDTDLDWKMSVSAFFQWVTQPLV